jgi:hypothetical protein
MLKQEAHTVRIVLNRLREKRLSEQVLRNLFKESEDVLQYNIFNCSLLSFVKMLMLKHYPEFSVYLFLLQIKKPKEKVDDIILYFFS